MTYTQEQVAAMVKRLRHNRPSHVDADIWMQDAADMLEQLAARTYEDGVRDAAKVAEYVPLKPGDMTRAILALLKEKAND